MEFYQTKQSIPINCFRFDNEIFAMKMDLVDLLRKAKANLQPVVNAKSDESSMDKVLKYPFKLLCKVTSVQN